MDPQCSFAKKKNRRSVLTSARRNFSNVDDSNNYQLADALAKTRVELSKVHKEKMQYVAQNLKFMETITHIKDENKRLNLRLSEQEKELARVQSLVKGHHSSIQKLNRSFDDLQVTVDGLVTPAATVVLSPPSLVSSFDSGLNASSLNSSSERNEAAIHIESAPLAGLKLLSPLSTPESDLSTSIPLNTDSDKENSETPKLPKPIFLEKRARSTGKRHKRKYPEGLPLKEDLPKNFEEASVDVFETPQVVSKKTVVQPRKRETPSRSAKLAVKSMAEPRLGTKLRQGDPVWDASNKV